MLTPFGFAIRWQSALFPIVIFFACMLFHCALLRVDCSSGNDTMTISPCPHVPLIHRITTLS